MKKNTFLSAFTSLFLVTITSSAIADNLREIVPLNPSFTSFLRPPADATLKFEMVITDVHFVDSAGDRVTVDTAPTFTGEVENQTYTDGTAINSLIMPMATGGSGILNYTLLQLPPGLMFETSTRTLSGTPTRTGVSELTYTVTDENDDTDTFNFIITVTQGEVNLIKSTFIRNDKGNLSADDSTTFTVTLKDINGNMLTDSRNIILTTGGARDNASWTIINNNDGTAIATYSVINAGLGRDGGLSVFVDGSKLKQTRRVTVIPGVLTDITLITDKTTLTLGDNTTLTAELRDAKGNLIAADTSVNFSSDNTAISLSMATVTTSTGQVIIIVSSMTITGNAIITVESGDKSNTIEFTVQEDANPPLSVENITVLEGNTFEQTITHNYDEDEAPTGYTLTLADGTTLPDWITVSEGKVVASPLYSVVESGLTHKQFSFKVSTSGKTPNVTGEIFTVTVINNSENPIAKKEGEDALSPKTMPEDTVGLYNILSHYTSAIGLSSSFQLKPNYKDDRPNWVTFPNNKVRLTPTNSEVGTHAIPFKIVDILGNELSGELNLTVTNVNDAPIIVDRTAKPVVKLLKTLKCDELSSNITETFDLSTVFSDVDTDDVLTYEILPEEIVRNVKVSNPNFASLENSTLTFTFTTGSKHNGIYSMGIKATDKSNESVTSVITLIVGSYSSSPENSGLIVMTTCSDDDVSVSVRAPKSKSASSMSVRLGGSAISNREETIREKGVIYSASANNGESLRIGRQGVSKKIMTTSEGNSFSEKISGLTADITYHYRAYVISNDITAYGDVRDFILKTNNALGNENIEEVDFYISPNPSSGILNINVVEKTDYRLLNIRGQVLKRGVLPTGKSKISTLSFAKGIYFLSLKTSKRSFTKKVIRE